MSRFRPYAWLWILTCVVLVSDQLSKVWITTILQNGTYFLDNPNNPPITVIDGFFYIVHSQNDGAAWGMLSGQSFLLGILGVIALIAIYCFRKALALDNPTLQCAFGLIIGGILGNMIDRFRVEKVIDFLDFHLPLYGRYPSFNIADCGITVGVGLYIVYSFILDRRAQRETNKISTPQ